MGSAQEEAASAHCVHDSESEAEREEKTEAVQPGFSQELRVIG